MERKNSIDQLWEIANYLKFSVGFPIDKEVKKSLLIELKCIVRNFNYELKEYQKSYFRKQVLP